VSEPKFQKFLEILRSGDAEAVEQLLSDLEPFLKGAIRVRLFNNRARRVVDTSDIVQSLLKDFLSSQHNRVEASLRDVRAYLIAAARYKIAGRVRKERRRTAGLDDVPEPMSPDPRPCELTADRDFVDAVRSKLDDANGRLFDLFRQGRTWREIADEIGSHPDSLRLQLRRSIAAVLAQTRNRKMSDVR
jgi:DNA-directed RNA polymerase specialized sigma24 family protein